MSSAPDDGQLRWVDNHCHLEAGEAGASAVAEAVAAGVERLITVGTSLEHSVQAISVAREHSDVSATAGVHPHDASDGIDGLDALLRDPEIVAVGECGLDYHYDHSPRAIQREIFAAQIGLAQDHGLPLVIHTREAWDDTFDILDGEGMPERTVFHCFTGGPQEARLGLDRGAMLSFSGIVTFKNADDLRAAAALCPLDRLMVETDSPYLAPMPHRGKPNQPSWVPLVGAGVAAAKGLETAAVAEATWQSAHLFYGI